MTEVLLIIVIVLLWVSNWNQRTVSDKYLSKIIILLRKIEAEQEGIGNTLDEIERGMHD